MRNEFSSSGRAWPPPRRDGAALGFGLGFLVFGAAGLGRSAGAHFDAVWFYPLILISLGAAGLVGLLVRVREERAAAARRAVKAEPYDWEL